MPDGRFLTTAGFISHINLGKYPQKNVWKREIKKQTWEVIG